MNSTKQFAALAALALLVINIGCKTIDRGIPRKPSELKFTFYGQDITKKLVKAKIPVLFLYVQDHRYHYPTEEWLDKHIGNFVKFRKKTLPKYKRDVFDCEDYVREFIGYTQRLNKKEKPVAIGEFFYKTDGGYYHAINIIVTDLDVIFYDPQEKKRNGLSLTEINSCYIVKF